MENVSLAVINEDNRYNKQLTNFQCYLCYFFIFSFLGWAMETIYSYIVLGHFANRGFFYGPICPIYGFGGLILILFLNKYKHNPIKLFIYAILIFSIFEYAIGFGLDALYNLWLWDYRNELLNLNGRICLFYSLSWGIVAIVFAYVIFPLFKKTIAFISSKVPTKLQVFLIRITTMVFVCDILYSFIEYSNFNPL